MKNLLCEFFFRISENTDLKIDERKSLFKEIVHHTLPFPHRIIDHCIKRILIVYSFNATTVGKVSHTPAVTLLARKFAEIFRQPLANIYILIKIYNPNRCHQSLQVKSSNVLNLSLSTRNISFNVSISWKLCAVRASLYFVSRIVSTFCFA